MSARIIIVSASKASDGSANIEVSIHTWSPDVRIRWNLIVARNPDSKMEPVELYLKRGTQKHYLNVAATTTGNRTVEAKPHTPAPGDYQVCANFPSSSSGDSLELYAFGEIVS